MAPRQAESPVAGSPTNHDTENRNNEEDNRGVLSFDELVYGVESFYAIVGPVFLTMLLSALSVVYISTPESKAQGEENLSSSYIVLSGSDDDTNGEKLGQSVVNGLIIVGAITVMTFVIVFLYKYRCMKCLLGYMVFASAMLLGFLSSEMFTVAIDRYQLNIDKITFGLLIYNFAAVGVFSIFFGKGATPTYIAQFYLIASSVIVAWHLSHFDPWTAWVLLVLLALYDLFAVLTPCGPLKALVKLMQRDDAPDMPGLLYEASLSRGAARPNQNVERNTASSEENDSPTDTAPAMSSPGREANNAESAAGPDGIDTERLQEQQPEQNVAIRPDSNQQPSHEVSNQDGEEVRLVESTNMVSDSVPQVGEQDDPVGQREPRRGRIPLWVASNDGLPLVCPPRNASSLDQQEIYSPDDLQREGEIKFPNGRRYEVYSVLRDGEEKRYVLLDPDNNVTNLVNEQGRVLEDVRYRERATGMIPLAVAKLNKLAFVEGPQPSWVRRRSTGNHDDSEPAPEAEEYTTEQLRQEVHVVFPRNGWRIQKHSQQREGEETRYAIIKPDGSIKRIVFVNEEGRVFEDLREKNRAAAAQERKKERTSIKLGLGDFIFYSILVSKAALYSFATFFACALVIVVGLGLTLLILAVRGKALPALPISIFLGVSFYLITRYSMEPWMQEVFIQGTYV